ncbi:MAG: tail fiber domain-containing protein [Actinomycetota bacterium]
MYRKIIYMILFVTGICYSQVDTVITAYRDTVNNVTKYDTLIYPQMKPVSAPVYQFLYNRRDTNNTFNQSMWYDGGRGALWFKKDMTKKYNLLIYDSLFNYLNNKSAYGYLGEGTDNFLAKFTTSSQTAVIPVMTSNTTPSGQASASNGSPFGYGGAGEAFNENETFKSGSAPAMPSLQYADWCSWNSYTPDSSTAWIMYKFPTQKSITKYQIGAGYWYQNYEKPKQGGGYVTVYKLFAYPTAWKLYGSIDSSTWVRLDSCGGQSFGGAVDTTGLFVNGAVASYSLNSVTRATFTDKENIGGYLYYKLQITAFTSGNGINFNTDAYFKIYIGAIQMYEGATVNFADSKISQSSGNDTVTANAIFKTTDRIEANGSIQANGMITSLKDGIKFYDTYTPYKYNLFETYGQTDNVIYRFPKSLPSSNQYIKALTIAGSNPSIITLGWGTDATGGGGSTGGNVWKGSDTTVNKLTKWSDGHTVTGSNFIDNGAVPMYGSDTLATRAWHRTNDLLGSVGSGEANTASNLGGTYGWFNSKVGVNLGFKGFSAGTGISVADNGTYYTISSTGGGATYVGNKISTATLPLYKTNDTTLTLKGLSSVGSTGQVIKTDGTNLYWGADETASGSGGGDVYKYSTGGTNGYLAKWYNSNTIMNSSFSESASAPFWNGDTLIRRSYWRLHDRVHPLTSITDHSFSDWGGFPGDTMILKTNGASLFWGRDQVGTSGGGSGDLTGTGYATTYIRPYSYWTGAKTLGYKGTYMGIRDSSYGIDGNYRTVIPNAFLNGFHPLYNGDSMITNSYYKLHTHSGTNNKLAKWGATNNLEEADIDYNKTGTAVLIYKSSGTLSINAHDYYWRNPIYGDTWRAYTDNYDMSFGAVDGAIHTERIRFKNDGKVYGTGADGTLGYFITKPDTVSNPGLASKWYVDSRGFITSGVTGSGTANKVARFTGSTTIGNGSLSDDGTNASTSGTFTTTTLYSTGDVIAYYGSSDSALKRNIETLKNPTEKLKQLRGVSFVWNDLGYDPGAADIGVIAQEIEKIIPTAVVDRGDGYKAVHLEKVVPVLIEANKEMLNRIETLEKIVKELREKTK